MKTRRREKKREQGKQEPIHARPSGVCLFRPEPAGPTSTRQGWIDDERRLSLHWSSSRWALRSRKRPAPGAAPACAPPAPPPRGAAAPAPAGSTTTTSARRGAAPATPAPAAATPAPAPTPPAPTNLTPTPPAADRERRRRHPPASGAGLAPTAPTIAIGLAHHRQAGRGVDTVDQRRRRRMEVRLPRLLPRRRCASASARRRR